jgi:large subunit ribosomal protein L4
MELEVFTTAGAKTERKVTLEDAIYGIEPNDHAIYLDVKQYMANKRQGTHSSKEKSQLTRSTRKIKKQKGTGGARAGSMKNPLFRGGARVFGPHPRDYSFKLNKKLKKLARISALSYKAKESNITIVEDFNYETPKTKTFVELLKSFQFQDQKTLLVVPNHDTNVALSLRNLRKVRIIEASNLNTYEILDANKLLVMESSVKEIEMINKN